MAVLLRLALFETYGEGCQWCRKPLVFSEMEIDHLIPQSCSDERLAELIEMHGLRSDFDVQATYNLVPSCGSDNRHKSDRTPPDVPIISMMLKRAEELAPRVEDRAQRHKARNGLDKLVALLLDHPDIDLLDDAQRMAIESAIGAVSFASTLSTGHRPAAGRIHPLGGMHDFVPPELNDVTDDETFGAGDMYAVVEQWFGIDYGEAREVFAGAFDHDDGKLIGIGLRDVTALSYSDEMGAFLARLDLWVEYMFFPPDDVAAPADEFVLMDVWLELDESRSNVVSAFADLWTSFG